MRNVIAHDPSRCTSSASRAVAVTIRGGSLPTARDRSHTLNSVDHEGRLGLALPIANAATTGTEINAASAETLWLNKGASRTRIVRKPALASMFS